MMKKLLVLILVLAMGSLASAGLQLTASALEADLGAGVSIGIDAANQPANVAVFILLSGVGTLDVAGATNTVGDGFIAKMTDLGVAPGDFGANDGAFAELVRLVIPAPILNGTVVSGVRLSSDVEGVAALTLMDMDTGAILGQPVAVTFVPEPASMILLGLGGLFLRRRK